MNLKTAILMGLGACPVLCSAVQMASQPFVTNRIAAAATAATNYTDAATNAALSAAKAYADDAIQSAGSVTPEIVTNIVLDVAPAPDFTTGNAQLVATIAATAPAPDLSTNNAVLVETIEATAPAPGDYAAVSNAAIYAAITNALQDTAIAGKASKSDATLSPVYSDVPTFSKWTILRDGVDVTSQVQQPTYVNIVEGVYGWDCPVIAGDHSTGYAGINESDALSLAWSTTLDFQDPSPTFTYTATRERTDIIGYRLGPDASGNPNRDKPLAALDAVPPTVTNIIRDLSLGGIWDEALQVWWTPRMRSGSLTYEATTNVNLNAEN